MINETSTERELVEAIRADWNPVSPYAEPYLDAMEDQVGAGLSLFRDPYIADPPGSIVLYFLSNATSWRGEVAREVKAELKRRS